MAYQFDEAVLYYGKWVESKLNERKKDGTPKYTIKEVIEGRARPASLIALMAADTDTFDI